MAKFFPLDYGETSSSRNSYQPSEGLLHRAEGFYSRPSRGLAPANATEYISTNADSGLYCGSYESLLRNIVITIFYGNGEYTFYVYDTKSYDSLIKTIKLTGDAPKIMTTGGTIELLEFGRNSRNSMSGNPFVGRSIILVPGIGTNLKFLDDDLTLKDFYITTTAGRRTTPVCYDVSAGQQRLVYKFKNSVDKTKIIDGVEFSTEDLTEYVVAFSRQSRYDELVISAIDAASAFESILADLGPMEEMYNITCIKKQVIITTSEGLWVIRSVAEETKPLSFDNQFVYKVDNVPAVPGKAVQFDNNFVVYAATNGILRIRQYNSLVDVSFPTTDPGGVNMPAVHEEFRQIKKIFYIGNPYLLMVLDGEGDLYAIGTSFPLKVSSILFPRTTYLLGRGIVDGGGPSLSFVEKKGGSYRYYRDDKRFKAHRGLQYEYYPALTVTSQTGQQISINIDHLSRMLIKIDEKWVQFRYDGESFSAVTPIPDINGQSLSFIPLLTSPSYVNLIPRWRDGVSAYQFTISGTSYVVESNVFDIRFDDDFATIVSSCFIEEVGVGKIIVESDTLPGLDSHIKEVGLMWNDVPDITYGPLPKEDTGSIIDPERTLYRHSFSPEFRADRNTFAINIKFSVGSTNDSYIAIARIYTI